MLLDKTLAIEVQAAWERDQYHPNKSREQRPIPAVDEFAVLIDTVFCASLLHEEGVPISTCVTWISRSDFETRELGRRRESPLLLEFEAPLDFSAHTLAKMNKVGNGKTATLLACPTVDGPRIWGICYFLGETSPLGEIPAMTKEARHLRPDYPTVATTGVGALQISRGGTTIGRLEGGRFSRAQPTVLTSYMLGQYLYRLTGNEIDFTTRRLKNEAESDSARSFLLCVEYLIEVLAQRRTGATIIFVPTDKQAQVLAESSTAWSVKGSLEIDHLLMARSTYNKQAHSNLNMGYALFSIKTDQGIRDRLRNLVDLANMDGALILTPSLEVCGFGMKLKAPKWTGSCEHGPVTSDDDKLTLDFTRLGTRHNSALDFVGRIDGAVAFVASSDGPIRALTKSTEDKVWYWPDCRVSMSAR